MKATFYRLYRPKKFSELVGQDLIRTTLKQAIKENRIAHAFLFTGPRGTGKTTTARIFAKAVNCLTPIEQREDAEPCENCQNCQTLNSNRSLDLVEIDAASYTGVDNIRQLTENIELAPTQLKYRVFIIDEVHMLSKGAFNALLKTLEEPPAHTIFILATTEQHKVLPTITSRCQKFSFRLLTLPEITKKLSHIAQSEEIKIDDMSLELIAEASNGGMRDAESLFSQIVLSAGADINSDSVMGILGLTTKENEIQLLSDLFEIKTSLVLERINNLLFDGVDFFLLSSHILNFLRKILFLKFNSKGAKTLKSELSKEQIVKLEDLSNKIGNPQLLDLMSRIVQCQPNIKSSSLPHLPLEIALVQWCLTQSGNIAQNNPTPISSEIPEKKTENFKKLAESEEKIPPQPQKKEINDSGNEVADVVESIVSEEKPKEIKKSEEENLPNKEDEKKDKCIDFKLILSNWLNITQNIRSLQPALYSSLKVCSPVCIEEDTLVIATPFKFHQDRLNDGRNRKIFCEELKKAVGMDKMRVVQDEAVSLEKKDEDVLGQIKGLMEVKET